MKLDERKSTDFYHFPVEETKKVLAYMAKAEITDDLAALKRGTRLLLWLYRAFKDDICRSDEPLDFETCEFANIRQFNIAWKNEVEKPL